VNFKPYYYFETGCAAHLFGCGGLGKCAVVDAHEEDVDAYLEFAAGQEIELGNTRVKVLYTPESASFVVTGVRRGTDPWFVLTGDTLFVGAVGRPDLPGRTRENGSELYDSIHEELLKLPDELAVYPGHFSESVCGAGMGGQPSSPVAFEKRCNPLRSKTREEFVETRADVPPKPAAMEQILRINQGRDGSTP
jgi:glyoxylase-like metal-dependent hydrolase (beta-lactamase superfamily II)